jgi:hypothetical protein
VQTFGSSSERIERGVGPVLARGAACDAVLRALAELNPDLVCVDRGAYVRVYVPVRCVLQRGVVERHSGQAFRLPGDLEIIMPSFKGRLRMSEDEVVWEVASP